MSRVLHIRTAGLTGHSEREVIRPGASLAGQAHPIRGELGLQGDALALAGSLVWWSRAPDQEGGASKPPRPPEATAETCRVFAFSSRSSV
jgi:hypothetical protein